MSTGLLITAGVVAVIFVVLYNIQISRITSKLTPDTKKVLKVNRDIPANQIPERSDLDQVEIPISVFEALNNPMEVEYLDTATTTRVANTVTKGSYLLWADLHGNTGPETAGYLSSDEFIGHPLVVDPKLSIGDIVRVGNYVDIYGVFPMNVKGKIEMKPVRILEAVRIVTVGGKGRGTGASRAGDPVKSSGSRRYSELTVEIKRDEAPVLISVLTRNIGPLRVVLLNKNVKRNKNRIGLVNSELRNLKPLVTDDNPFTSD